VLLLSPLTMAPGFSTVAVLVYPELVVRDADPSQCYRRHEQKSGRYPHPIKCGTPGLRPGLKEIIGETRTGLLSVSGVGVFSAVIDLSCGRRLFRWRRYALLDTRSGSVHESIVRCGRTTPQRDYECAEN